MASGDIGNQLAGVGDGLDRFLEALDSASYSMGSNAALQASQARAAKKIEDDHAKALKKNFKIEEAHAKQIKSMLPVHKKLMTGLKDETKERALLNKGMKAMSKSMTDFAKKALGGLGKAMGSMAKAGVLGGMVASVKLISDGLLRGDAAMAKLSARTGMTRKALAGVREEAGKAQDKMSQFGITMEESLATSGNLIEAFGRADAATGKLVESSIRLQKGYGLSAEAAANLVKEMQLAGRSADEFANTLGVKATKAGMSASLIMRDLAAHSQKISMYGERASDAYVDLAVQAAKAGTSLAAFEGVEGAHESIDQITDNFGILESMVEGFNEGLGTTEEKYMAIWKGGEAQVEQVNKYKKRLGEMFDVYDGALVKQGTHIKVDAGVQRQAAKALGFTQESLKKITELQDRMARKKAGQMTDDDKAAERAAAEDERVEEAMNSRMNAMEKLSAVWTGLYSTLVEQMDLIFGAGGMGAKITELGESLKSALDLGSLKDDVNKEGGGWATAIGDRLSAVLKGVIAKVFGITPDAVAGLGKAAAGIAAVMVGYKAVTKGMEVLGLKRNKDKLGLTRGNAMFVENVGGLGAVASMAGGKGGPAGAVGTLTKIFGKSGGFLNALLKRAPLIGAALQGGMVVMAGMDRLTASSEEQKKIAEKKMAAGTGGMAGALIGGAIGTAILPGIGTAIGAALGSWLGGEAGEIIYDNMDTILKWFEGPIASFKAWTDTMKIAWDNIVVHFNNVVDIATSAFNILSHGANLAVDWASEMLGFDIKKWAASAFEAIGNAFSWENINKILKVIVPGYAVIAEGADVLAKGTELLADASSWVADTLSGIEEDITGTTGRVAQEKALGGIGGGLSIVGEAGGEVITSASALRSGIGVSGRAASALAGIGVPGYANGTVGKRGSRVSEGVGTEGLIDALGSQELKRAYAEAVTTEIGQQQAAMNDYWRRYYEMEMREAAARGGDDAGSGGGRGKGDGEKFADGVKYLFNEYPGLVDKSMQAGLSKAFKGEVPLLASEMYKGVFSGMLAWSDGDSPKKALRLGVMAGMGAALQEGGTINKFMTEIKTGNSNLLYAMEDGISIETQTLKDIEKRESTYTESVDKTERILLLAAAKARKAGETEQLKALVEQRKLLLSSEKIQLAKYAEDKKQQQVIIDNLKEIKKSTEGSETQAKLQYSATRGITSALDAAMATFMAGGSMGDMKDAAIGAGVSQGVMGLGSAFAGTEAMDTARGNLGSSADVMSKYSIGGGRQRAGGSFGIPGFDPGAMASQRLGQAETSAQTQGYGTGSYAMGGVITSPTIALLGEGGLTEAIVPKPAASTAPTPAATAPVLGKDPLAGLAGPGEGPPEAPGEEGALEGEGGMEDLAPLGESVAGEGGAAAAGAGGGAGGGGMEQILMMILATNQGISSGVMGVSSGIGGLSGATSAGLAGVNMALEVGFMSLTEMLTGSHAESTALLTAIGTLLGEIGTDISKRMGKMIKHLSKIDTKVARHPSSIRHSLKLQQGAATGAAKEAGKESAKKTAGSSVIAPAGLGPDAIVNAGIGGSMGGMKGGRSGAKKAWDGLERKAKGTYVNKPTVMMVGEEGRGEIVIPTERIRKGLPIDAGVAAELGSIGVPGFAGGTTHTFGQSRSGDRKGALGAGAATTFSDVFAGTGGDWKQALTGAAGGGVENALVDAGVPPEFAEMGGMLVTKGINKLFGLTGGQGKGRRRTLQILEEHIKSRGLFDFGQPPGLKKWINRAVGGKEKIPTEENYKKLMKKLGKSKLLASGGLDPAAMIALGTGKVGGVKAFNAYKAMNIGLYGSAAGDKYMKAIALPQLADGGIVTKPTTAVLGEKGPEMVIPLHEQRDTNAEMIKELKKQNELMNKMIKTQVETGGATVRLDGRVIAETVGENFYDMGTGM